MSSRQRTSDVAVIEKSFKRQITENLPNKSVTGLLSHEEEIKLSRLVRQRIKWEEKRLKLMKNLKREPTLSEWALSCFKGRQIFLKDEEFAFALQRSEEAKAKIINSNLRLVISLARKHKLTHKTRLHVKDLVHEGIFGLFRAVEKYDPERGFRFSTIATWWIRQSIIRAIANHCRVVRLPVHVQDSLQSVRRAERELSVALGREPSRDELCTKIGATKEKLEWLYSCEGGEPVSMNVPQYLNGRSESGGDSQMEVEDILSDSDLNPEDHLNKLSAKDQLNNLLLSLHPKERIVVRLRYGLDNGGVKETFTRIGSEVGVAKERARQIEFKAMERLRTLNVPKDFVLEDTQS
eukprot:CAMPEP_0171458118 /NCGR_PEP_ID=MMETSP0945-20130129/3923_1 /TAXON_ID=109269 /ORGANISM="Vaucheria litorea, Strain CCMP2940" /LENGTH=350 /DNA_ID=CAMNT_0011983859 /DNA_START=263 /DNA_END=1315 /DNA_ORIENTATION=-